MHTDCGAALFSLSVMAAAAAAVHCNAAAAASQDACSRRHSLWLLG